MAESRWSRSSLIDPDLLVETEADAVVGLTLRPRTPSNRVRLVTSAADYSLESVDRGRRAAEHNDWEATLRHLTEADHQEPLEPADLALLGTAAYLLGRVDLTIDALGRAHRLWIEEGQPDQAIRSGFWAAFALIQRGEMAQAGGWLARCHRLLADLPEEGPERGFLLVPEGFRKATMERDFAGANAVGEQVVEFGRRWDEPDLLALGLNICGRALVWSGDVEAGLACLDEAMVAVISGELSPPAAGTVYCSLIEACDEISEWRRAHEWTGALTRWCEQNQGMITFTGQCLTHRSVLARHRGDWPGAEAEARRACETFVGAADEQATGRALYHLGEVHRLRGENGQAEDAYRRAGEWGHEPQPGLALLRLAQGRIDSAVSALQRLLAERSGATERLPLLPATVEVMLEAGRLSEAAKAVDELEQAAAVFRTSALQAEAARARGRLSLAEDEAEAAVAPLRAAQSGWMALDAPYETARTRLLIAQACRALGDLESAEREEEAARKTLADLGARALLDRLADTPASAAAHGLTARELEILQLLATGMTNQDIADQLYLAVRTVDRHVSNILTKLAVPSRTAAAAFAYQHHLV